MPKPSHDPYPLPPAPFRLMTYILTLLMLLIIFACIATLYTEGLWSNIIRLVNVVTAALLATNFFEPAADWLDEWQPSYTYVWDFLVLWGLFSLFMLIFNAATDFFSRVKVRFLGIVDRIGGALFALLIGWVMVCFTMMTLHTAPLARKFLFEGFNPNEQMILGLAPDRQWLGFFQNLSYGSLCRWTSERGLGGIRVRPPRRVYPQVRHPPCKPGREHQKVR